MSTRKQQKSIAILLQHLPSKRKTTKSVYENKRKTNKSIYYHYQLNKWGSTRLPTTWIHTSL